MAAQFEQIGAAGARLVLVERLDQEIGGAGFKRVVADAAVIDHRDDNDGNVDAMRQSADLFHELDTVELRQLVVGEDHVDAVVPRELERAARRVEELEVQLPIDLADDLSEQEAAAEKVVDDEDRIALGTGECQLRDDSRRAGLRGIHGVLLARAAATAVTQEVCPGDRGACPALLRPGGNH